MEDLIIINAGGYGKTVSSLAESDSAHCVDWRIMGMLDGRKNLAFSRQKYPIVGDPDTFEPNNNQIFVCALGEPSLRRRYSHALLSKGARFINLIPLTERAVGVSLKSGGIYERHTAIGADSHLGEFVLMHSYSIIGHDVVIGDYTTIGSFVFIGGNARIGNDVMIFPHATILPSIIIGDGARIGAGSVVVKNVPANATVFGNPAKIVF